MRASALFGIAAAAALAGCNTVYGPTTPDKNWSVTESAHFSLYTRPGTFAEKSAAALGVVLDDQYETTVRLLQSHYAGHISGFLYNDAADAGLPGEDSGVAFPDTGAFRATATPPLDDNLYGLVQHEANHVLIIGSLGHAGTSMMTEGLASAVVSERYANRGAHFYYTWTRAHASQVIPIAQLADDGRWPNLPSNAAYSFAFR
jgi:hypothetical protein